MEEEKFGLSGEVAVQPSNKSSPGTREIPGTRERNLFRITHEHFFSNVKEGDIESGDHRYGNQNIHLMHGVPGLELERMRKLMLVYKPFSNQMQTRNIRNGS